LGNVLFFAPKIENASRFLEWIATEPGRTNIGPLLDDDWRVKHLPILHDECPPLGPAPKRVLRPSCHAVGVCLCSGPGPSVYKLRNKFLRQMKLALRKGSRGYELLVSKKVVACLRGHRDGAESPWEAADRVLDGDVADASALVKWWHIGAQCFSPYVPTFHACMVSDRVPPVAEEDEVQLEVDIAHYEHLA
jgi:hypothetical protein